MTPGAPGTALPDRIRWALAAASGPSRACRGREWPVDRLESCGYVVTLTRHHLPYGSSAHAAARYTHLVRYVWLCWHQGRPVAARVRWWCGSCCDSTTFGLTAEPTREICPMCQFAAMRAIREAARE